MPSPPNQGSSASDVPLPPVPQDWLAALFSFLIPGLGQVYQGRISKGLLFFLGLYLLFFYGMWMGQWKNVWIPDLKDGDGRDLPAIVVLNQQLEGLPKALAYRPQYLGQFWIGLAAWPAIYQYEHYERAKESGPLFGKFERMPSESDQNEEIRNGDKRIDLGWVFTVIAGVLNMLVIYDALAGPMFRDGPAIATAVQSQPNAAAITPAAPERQPAAAAAEPLPAAKSETLAPTATGEHP